MALIGKIRNNMWLVFIIIALATASFILMDAMGPGGGGFGGPSASTPIGVIGGEKVLQSDFNRSNEFLFGNVQDPNAKRDVLWNYYTERGIINNEAEALGMSVGREELMDLQFGANMSPVVRSNFATRTGQLDVNTLQQFKNILENGEQIDPQRAMFWSEQEKQIKKEQLQSKINSLAQKAIYTPNWLAESGFNEENGSVDIAVVKIPFDNLPTGDLSVSDADINSYIAKNKDTYELKEEMRQATYVTYNLVPSPADSAKLLSQMNEVITNFKTTPNDSIFAIGNNGFYSLGYGKAEQLDEFYKDRVASYEIGQVYGPYVLGPSYQAVKLIDKRVLPDSVKARHILRNVAAGNISQLDAANTLIDSLQDVLSRNNSKFAELAEEFSQDPGSSAEGGDLGYFPQGRMVKPFNDVCFLDGQEGGLYKVQTNIGVHLIYIEDQKYTDRAPGYQLAYVNTPILPGDDTQTKGYDVMLELISTYPYLSDLKTAAASNPSVTISTSDNIDINGYQVGDLQGSNTSREVVKWLFNNNTDVNDMSQTVYEYTNPVSFYPEKYVVVGLEKVNAPGMMSAADVRDKVEFAILNEKKGAQAVSQISGSDLRSIAGQYSAVVDTLRNISLLNNFVPGLGNEPAVLGAAYGQENGSVSAPILGSSGVFVVKTLNKSSAGDITGLSSIKKNMAGGKKSALQFGLLEALKDHHEVKDNRSVFY